MFDDPTSLYNIMKGNLRTGGSTGGNNGGNWFEKKAQSINNAIGTTGAAFASAVKDAKENKATANLLQDNKTRMNNIAKKYGYNTYHDVWDAREKAEKEGDTKTLELIDNTINPELQGQATANAEKATQKAKKYDYYRKNDTLSKMVNQDSGKFLGSAINTLSTATDVLGLTNGPLSNAVQGGIEGIADELEQNGLRDFDWNRAGQNAISGAVSGAAVGAVNNGISGALAKRGGNLFKGGNAITSAMNNLGANTALGRGASTLATGAVRGGISGAVGGATGAGTSAFLNGQDVMANALQGAKQGFQSGVGTGAIMAGANSALNKTKFMQQMNQANQEWQGMGKNNIERIKNTLNDTEPTQTPTETPVQRLAQVAQPDEAWDNVAKQAGYNDFNEVVNQFMRANPNAAVNANNVLEWLDNNSRQGVIDRNWQEPSENAVDRVNDTIDSNESRTIHLGKNLSDEAQNANVNTLRRQIGSAIKDVSGDGFLNGTNPRNLPLNAGERNLEKITGGDYKNIDEMFADGLNLEMLKNGLSNKDYQALLGYAREVADIQGDAIDGQNQLGARTKSELPILNRQQYYEDTIGSLRNKDGSKNMYVSAKDVPDYMRNRLSNNTTGSNDSILREFFNDQDGKYDMNQLYEMYERIAQTPNANEIYTPDNLRKGLYLAGADGERIIKNWAEKMFNNRRSISVDDKSGRAKTINVNRPEPTVDINDESTYPEDIQTMRINNLPEEDMQIQETQQTRDVINPKQQLRDIKATQLETRAAEDLLSQLGTVPKPVAHADNMVENTKAFIKEGLTKPEEWELASNAVTGQNGVLSKLHRNLVAQAGDIDTFSGKGGRFGNNIEDTIDYMIKAEGLVDTHAEGLKNEITAVMESLPSRLNGSLAMTDSANDVMRAVRELESHRRHYLGEDSRNRSTTDPFKDQKARVLKNFTTMLEDRIYDKIPDASKVVTQDAINELKSYFPNNEKWAKSVDEKFANIKTGKDLRAAQKRYVQTADYLKGVKENFGTYGQRVGDTYGNALSQAVRKVPVVGGVLAQATSTPFMQRRYADINMARADKLRGVPVDLPSIKSAREAEIITPSTTTETPTDYNPATQIYNTIGRREGLTNAEQARTANYLTDAVQANNALMGNTYGDNSLESLVVPTTSNSVYNNVNGNLATATTTNGNNGSYFQKTGDYWTDIIGDALTSAINDRDVTAFAQLYEMYQDQLANLQKNASSTSGQKLNTTQQRANAALTSWQRLSQMTPDLGYNLSNIPIIGGIATLGGNDYEGEAKSLAQQIGYMVSGANIKQEEAENIGKAYVPQPWDSENTRKLKLQRAYEIIQQYQNNIAE